MGDAFLAIARNGRSSAQGKKTNRPLRMPIEPSFSSVVFGQTCPIEIAMGGPADRSQDIRQWRHLAVIGCKRPTPLQHAQLTKASLIARFDAPDQTSGLEHMRACCVRKN